MPKKDMKKKLFIIFYLLFASPIMAKDYDAFVLNFLSVNPMQNMLVVHMVLDTPRQHTMEQSLQKGAILEFSIIAEILEERFLLPNKDITSKTISYTIQYERLTRQYIIMHNGAVSMRGTNIINLFDTLIKNIEIKIPTKLTQNETYILELNISLDHHSTVAWMNKNLFLFLETIIEPTTYIYEFNYEKLNK